MFSRALDCIHLRGCVTDVLGPQIIYLSTFTLLGFIHVTFLSGCSTGLHSGLQCTYYASFVRPKFYVFL